MANSSPTRVLSVVAIVLACTSCSSEPTSAPPAAPHEAQLGGVIKHSIAYERGRWRVASFAELDRTVLWFSHILVRHGHSRPERSPLRRFEWSPEAPVTRSVEEARQLAERIAQRAQERPETFEQLVAEYSEDEVTRLHQGSLGAMRASSVPAYFLDAAQEHLAGQVSKVIQTDLGFHVVLLRNPPPEQRISGRRIVIRYEGTRGRGSVTRSRTEALELAQRLLRDAQTGVSFRDLVAKHSEGDDRALDGDLGAWSTHEPSPEPIAIEALAALRTGAVLDRLVESRVGLQILQRTELPERPDHVSFNAAFFRFNGAEPATRTEALHKARALLASARVDAASFSKLPGVQPIRWRYGEGDAAVTAAVYSLAVAQLAEEPIETEWSYAVVQRASDIGTAALPYQLELPRPSIASLALLDEFVQSSQPEQLAYSLGKLTELMGGLLSADEKPIVAKVLAELATGFQAGDTPEKRLAAYRAALTALHRSLSMSRYAMVTSLIQRWVSHEMMSLNRP